MKSKSILCAALAAFCAAAGAYIGVSMTGQNESFSDLQLANIEALTDEEKQPVIYQRECFSEYTERTLEDPWYMEVYICKFCGETRFVTKASELMNCLQIVYPETK